jgi:hypothetical protein
MVASSALLARPPPAASSWFDKLSSPSAASNSSSSFTDRNGSGWATLVPLLPEGRRLPLRSRLPLPPGAWSEVKASWSKKEPSRTCEIDEKKVK